MPEDQIAFYAALIPIVGHQMTVEEYFFATGEAPPGDGVPLQQRIDMYIEAACKLRLKYAETIVRLRGA